MEIYIVSWQVPPNGTAFALPLFSPKKWTFSAQLALLDLTNVQQTIQHSGSNNTSAVNSFGFTQQARPVNATTNALRCPPQKMEL